MHENDIHECFEEAKMSTPCTYPGCFHLAVSVASRTCAEHFLDESYSRVNDYSRALIRDDVDSFSLSEMKIALYAIADRACVIAQTTTLAKIDQIRLLELEELVGKTLCSMRAPGRNQRFPPVDYSASESQAAAQ
jgi:hypothetical protein